MARATFLGLLSAGMVAACSGRDSVAVRPVSVGLPEPAALTPTPEPSLVVEPEAPSVVEERRLAPGAYAHEVNMEGQVRKWTTVVPPVPDGGELAGLVVVLHGVGGRGADMRATTGFDPVAASRGVVLAYPDGLGGAWNDGRPGTDPVVTNTTVDDVRFLRLLIEATLARTGVERRHVAVVGFSNGAMMAGRVGCELADEVTAIVLVGGSGGQGFEQSCRPTQPVSALVVAGTDDPIVPYAGGKVADFGAKKRGFVAPVEDFVSFWLRRDGCSSTSVVAGQPVSELRAVNCAAATAVQRYRVSGGGHEWFRAPRFGTTDAIWQFVSSRFNALSYSGASPEG